MKNPNATVAAGGSGLSVLVVWLLGYLHVPLSAEDGAVIAGVVASVALFVGRNGIKGVWRRIVNGDSEGLALVELLLVLIAVAVILLVFGKTL